MMQVVLEGIGIFAGRKLQFGKQVLLYQQKKKRKDADSENFPASVLRMVYIEKEHFNRSGKRP